MRHPLLGTVDAQEKRGIACHQLKTRNLNLSRNSCVSPAASGLSYDEFGYVCQQARKKLGLKKPRREHKLPQLLSMEDLTRFFRSVREGGNVQHEIMLKLLFFTAVRVGELVRDRGA